ncbi:transposase [Actinomadura logoneensis]|uniref:transposase n=1 Tax=Actinomadura logoneensis TaxID=2293572 RepID=UPI0013149748
MTGSNSRTSPETAASSGGSFDAWSLRLSGPRRCGFDRDRYRHRNVVERCFNQLKRFRDLAAGYDKLAAHYRAVATIAGLMCAPFFGAVAAIARDGQPETRRLSWFPYLLSIEQNDRIRT